MHGVDLRLVNSTTDINAKVEYAIRDDVMQRFVLVDAQGETLRSGVGGGCSKIAAFLWKMSYLPAVHTCDSGQLDEDFTKKLSGALTK